MGEYFERRKILRRLKQIEKLNKEISFEVWSSNPDETTIRFVTSYMTKDEDIDKLLNDKANCYSKAYDIVINGYVPSKKSKEFTSLFKEFDTVTVLPA